MLEVGACHCKWDWLSSVDCSSRRRNVSIINVVLEMLLNISFHHFPLMTWEIKKVEERARRRSDKLHTNERQTQQASFSGNWQTG